MMVPKRKKTRPLYIHIVLSIVIILVLYLVIFIEIDGVNIYNILTQKSSIVQYNVFETPENQLLKLELQTPNQPLILFASQNSSNTSSLQHSFNTEPDEYFKIFEYIHNTPFATLSSTLQTRHLQELFRFQTIRHIHDRQKKGDTRQWGQRELLTILNDIYRQHHSGVNFVQIGACDGNWQASNDPIQKFILQDTNWHGVMLEPVPYLFDTLLQNINKAIPDWKHRILPINAALSHHNGYQKFYVVNPHFGEEMPEETHALKFQIGSFNVQHIHKHLQKKRDRNQLSQEVDYYIDAINVTTLDAKSVVQRYRESGKIVRDGSIDVLTIDAEGYDYTVLKSFLNNTAIRPLIVIYENLHLTNDNKRNAIDLLHSLGYIDIDDHWNTIAIRLSNL